MLCWGTCFSQIELGTYTMAEAQCDVTWSPETGSYGVEIIGVQGDGSLLPMWMFIKDPDGFRKYLKRTTACYRKSLNGIEPKWHRYSDVLLMWLVPESDNASFAVADIEPGVLDVDGFHTLGFFHGVTKVRSESGDTIKPVLFFDSIEEVERLAFLVSKKHLVNVITKLEETEQSSR